MFRLFAFSACLSCNMITSVQLTKFNNMQLKLYRPVVVALKGGDLWETVDAIPLLDLRASTGFSLEATPATAPARPLLLLVAAM